MKGVLLVNLGTPAAPTTQAVRAYLAQFLADPRVVKLPRLLWLPILHGIVLRTRPAKSAEKYAAIWSDQGSPLAVHTERQAAALRALLADVQVEYAMRYGEPSIERVLDRFASREVTVLPLYPQYAESTTASVADRLPPGLGLVRDFHDHPSYIGALAAGVRQHWERHGRGPMLLMSFHGLPKRGAEEYERQCHASARLLAQRLGLEPREWKVTFQSRFGYAEWLQPYTEPALVELAAQGLRRADVICPGFVSDCLETLEEIGIGARERFLAAGGREFHALPCLNEAPAWIAALAAIARGER